MTSAQVVETSVTVTDNSPFQDYPHPDDHVYTIDCHSRVQTLYCKRIIDHGLYKVGDLYDCVGELKITKEPLLSALSPVDIFLLFSMVKALPQAWRNLLNTNKTSITLTTHPLIYDQYRLHFENEESNLEKLQSKALYNKFISKINNIYIFFQQYANSYKTIREFI